MGSFVLQIFGDTWGLADGADTATVVGAIKADLAKPRFDVYLLTGVRAHHMVGEPTHGSYQACP